MLGTKDFAGGNVIHISAGVSAMAAVLVIRDEIYRAKVEGLTHVEKIGGGDIQFINIRPRKNSLNKDEILGRNPEIDDSQNSIVFVVIGTMLLWFGWFGFNGGSAYIAERSAILALVNTNICPCVSLLTWILLDLKYKGRPTVTGMCIAIVSGLVGITPAAGFVRVWVSVIIGIGSAIFPYIFTSIREKYKLFDDRLDVFGCHGIAGIWGGFCVGLFLCDIKMDNTCDPASIGAVYGNGMQIVYQLFGIVSTVVYCFVVSTIIMYCLKKTMHITVDRSQMIHGLDKLEFKENAIARFKDRKSYLKLKELPKNNIQIIQTQPDNDFELFVPNNENNKNLYPDEKNIDELKSHKDFCINDDKE